MDCTTTSTKTRSRGFTLVEMLVAIGISGMIFTVIATLISFSGRSFAAMTNYVDLDNRSRNALDRMSREIRQATGVSSWDSVSKASIALSSTNGTICYTYNPTTKTLTRAEGSASEEMLTQCDSLTFTLFQRNVVGGSYDYILTTDPGTCKMVQLSWVCSRKIFGKAVNTESVQSAKVVIRKH